VPQGIDPHGREILSYIPGETIADAVPWPDWVWEEGTLAQIAEVTADYHRAVADFQPAGDSRWQWEDAPLRTGQIVCHHDLAPYNVVVGGDKITGIIDWDLAGPGTPRSELAFIAWQWVPLQHPMVARFFGWRREPDYARRLGILLDSYGLEERSGFMVDVVARIAYNRDHIQTRAAQGVEAYVQLVRDGHIAGMNMAIEFLADEMESFPAELL
jgi:aminoglycoside phosphotransferase (APT) family kinase protein